MLLHVTVFLAAVFVIGQSVFLSLNLWDNFARQDNDDILRLVMVRDFIAGQGWYDVVQYRILPPDGMPLHWSRYIDAAIAAIIVPLSYIFPMPVAELLGASIWPALIQLISLTIIAFGTQRIFGTVAACFAVICLVLWPVTGGWNSAAGNIDHHNVQILMMTLMAICAVWPGRPFAAGTLGGLAAAFSLAVGLETLPFALGVGTIMLSRMLFSQTDGATTAVLAFCTALSIGSVAFWAGQTAPDQWLRPMCDRLSTPVLALVWIAALASSLPAIILRSKANASWRFLATFLLALTGTIVAWPLLSQCLGGPYGNLPQHLQDFISEGVGEALPGIRYFLHYPAATMLFLPALTVAPILIGLNLFNNWHVESMTSERRTALLGFGFLSMIGFGMMLVQMRAITLSAAIIPIIAGYFLSLFLGCYLRTRAIGAAFGGLVSIMIFIVPSTLSIVLHPLLPQARAPLSGGAECRTYDALIALNEVPPALLMTDFNSAPGILWLTHHDTLSGGFHTSATALANGVIPFGLEEQHLQDYLAATHATHFLICRNTTYPGAFVTALSAGVTDVGWLRRIPLSDPHPMLFEVLPE
ncbi:hypothetical protein SLH49_17870 [Cognatiyoonia sp. IB215446]|uniref:hypothetical protein n=1 Tax=Cognatiyoonia sp. IB215446 TaxID=3097355 RepID=UPI002A1167A0|nr:hypothetical protein [Cognatiyoonia sp. IB215446]MDX8349858.1 hypothetical protein [Cognatiyoonia sp. IB215446]